MNKRLFGLMIILACGIGLIIGLVAMEKPALAGPHDANLTRSHEDAGSISKAKNPVKDSDSSPLMALPLRFIPNVGQYAPEVSFSVQGAGHTLAFTPNGITMHAVVETENIPQEPAHPHTISLEFEGALPSPTLGGLDLMRGVINDFRGNDSAEWHANIPTYAGILYQDLYPGIDLVYRGTQGVLKSEFIVQPGVDPAMIRMHYQGLESLTLRDDGALVLTTPFGELIEAAPVIYQENTGKRQSITGRYVILAPDLVGFQIDAYDSTMPLVIDPELAYASYLGGSNSDEGNGIAVDKDGSIYVTGGTYSTDFPLVGHYQNYQADYDVFVTKIVNVYGTYDYAYSTYIGGSKVDIGQDIAIDKDGAAYVSGYTLSSDFPTQDALQPSRGGGYDAFVIRIDDLGGSCTLGYASYLGGSDNEYGYGIATGQGAGRTPTHGVAVVGQTYSNDFPTHNAPSEALSGTSDAFVVHMIMVGESYTYTYATYLGSSGFEDGKAIALDSDGNAHVTGYTTSVDFPTTKNALEQNPIGDYDAYLVRIAESGGSYTYTYASYLGGTGRDYGEGIAIDTQDRVYVTGNTDSTDLPTTAGVLQPGYGGGTRDAYVIQIVETGGFYSYGYATYVGGSDADYGWDIATDIEGNASVTGDTASADFPKFAPLDATLGGTRDAFVAQIIDAGSTYTYSYATYLGGGNLDRGWDIASAGYGHVYITGRTDSADFPTFKALDTTLSGSRDAFVAKILGQNGLKIQKTVTPDLIGIGQRLTYTLAFANESLSPTSGIIITDIVPITLTNLTVSHDGAAITPTGATNFTWQVATLGAEEGGTIEISGIADPSLSGVFSITNQATITSTTLEESPGDNVSSVSSSADLVRPQPPVLVAPGNGTSITDTTPTLVWQASSSDDVAGYRLNVDGAITDVGNVTSTTLSTLADGAYIWTVVAYDQANNSSTVPATRTFTVDTTPPTPPTLITPEDDAFLNDATPTLRWQASPDPDVAGYQLDLAGALIDVGNVTSYTTALLADGSYTWTVAAYDVLFTSAFTDTWTFEVDTAAPTPPTLLEPPDGAQTPDTTPTLIWSPSPDGDTVGYLVQWDTSEFDVGNVTSMTLPVQGDGDYDWSVAAYDRADNTGAFTDTWTLSIDATSPEPPVLQAPANGAFISATTPSLTWQASPDADVAGYWLDWNGALIDVGNTTTYATPVLADGVYTWTVAAYDMLNNTSAFTDTWTFTVDSTAPAAPVLVAPANGAFISTTTSILTWQASPDPDVAGYWLDWNSTLIDMGNTTTYATPVLADGAYTWTVAAYDALSNTSAFTDTWTFTVDTLMPSPPKLIDPIDNSVISDTMPTLTWLASPEPDVAGYWLDWNGALIDVGNTTTYATPVLADGAYTWTIAAYDMLNNTSAFTDTWTFTVDTLIPSPPKLIDPTNDSIITDTTPTLTWQANPEPDVVGYWLDWNGVLIDVGNVTSYTTALLADGSYTWTVAAYDVLFTSAFTDTWTFEVDTAAPTPPTLLEPPDGVQTPDTTPTLIWSPSPDGDTVGYLVQWDTSEFDVGNVTSMTLPVQGDGDYDWSVAAYDRADNTGAFTDTWTLSIDATPPEPPVLQAPANGAFISATTPSLTWQASPDADVAGYQLDWNGTLIDVGNVTSYTTPVLADGVYTWTVAAYDMLNNTSAFTDTWTFTVDSTAPAAPVLAAPANGAFINDTTPSLTWLASPDPDVAGYWLDWNSTLIDMGNTTTYATPVLADGVYTWTVAAYDALNNTSAFTDTWTFTVDATAPAIPVLAAPANGAFISDTTPSLTWQASPDPDVAGYQLDWNGALIDVGNTTTYATPALADGVYTWTIAAYDTLSNTSAFTDTWTFTVDATAPSPVTLITPENGTVISDTMPTLRWLPSPEPDVAGYRLDWNGALIDVGNVTSYTTPLLADGIYTWTVAVYDVLHNASAYASTWTFTVNTTPPTPPTLIMPEDGAFLNDATPTLRWQASPEPDVAGYWLNLDGALIDVGNVTSYTTALLADGVYTWTIAAYDVFFTSAFTDTWTFEVDTAAPTPPTLLEPPDGAQTPDTTPTLIWSPSPDGDTVGYLVQWDTSEFDVGNVTSMTLPVQGDGDYDWSVAAYDRADNTGAFTDTWTLSIDATPPEPPVLQAPANGAFISATTPSLTWQASPDADVAGYWLDWNGILIDVGNVTSYTTPVLADGVYTWTVAAYDMLNNTSAFTDTWTFTVDSTAPAAPVLVAPANGAFISDTTPSLTWQASPDPDVAGYRLDWNGTLIDVGNTTTYATPVLADGVYTWTVAAYDGVHNTSAFTDTWTFTVDATPPATPVLVFPEDASVISDTLPALTWEAVTTPDTAGYLLDWNGTVLDVGLTTTYTTSLLADGEYQWTVAAYDTLHNVGAFAATWSFRVDTKTPTPPVLATPPDGTLTDDTTPTFTWSASPDSDVLGYLFKRNGTIVDVPGGTTAYTSGPLSDGIYTWTVAAYDTLYTSAFTDAWQITIDTTPPTPPALESPTNGVILSDTTPTLMWRASPTPDTAGYLLNLGGAITDLGDTTQYIPVLAPGTYTWTVAAYDPLGNTSVYTDVWTFWIQEIISGLDAGNDSPTALGNATNLIATIETGTDVSYTWALGDGDMASGPNVAHIYPAPGSYTAVVTASNGINAVTATTTITIQESIAGLVAENDSPTLLGDPTNLTATITAGTDVTYVWDLGDGNFATGPVVAHTYAAIGNYTAIVTASNEVSVMTAATTIDVNDVPIAGLVAGNDGPTPLGILTNLTATVAEGTNVIYTWTFGDEEMYDLRRTNTPSGVVLEEMVSHLYPTMGAYTAVVTASNSVNFVTATTTVEITPGCVAQLNNGPTRYDTVQAAVDASTQATDVVKVAGVCSDINTRGGTQQIVYLTKTIELRGGYRADFGARDPIAYPTTLDAASAGRALLITGNIAPRIESFHITNGFYDGANGGGIYVLNAHPTISDCQITNNMAMGLGLNVGRGGGIAISAGSDVLLYNNQISNNTAQYHGGGLYAHNGSHGLTISANTFTGNIAGGYGGAMMLNSSDDATIEQNLIASNTATQRAGGLAFSGQHLTLHENVIRHNEVSEGDGGGIYLGPSGEGSLINNIIAGNIIQTTGNGAGMALQSFNVAMLHNTIAGNQGGNGQGVYINNADLDAMNTILAGHAVGLDIDVTSDVTIESTLWGTGAWANGADVQIVPGSTVLTGTVNIWEDPVFVDAPGGDYHLSPGSGAIEAGIDSEVAHDIDGDARPLGLRYDIGADEYRHINDPITGLTAINNSPTPLGNTTQFSASVETGTGISYTWDFGDGATGTGATVTHAYTTIGRYTAVVTAANTVNITTTTTEVIIEDAAITGLAINTNSPNALGDPTTFEAVITTGSNVVYAWTFGDGATGAGAQTAHTYAVPDYYTVVVTATNGVSEVSVTTRVHVYQKLVLLPGGGAVTTFDGRLAFAAPVELGETLVISYTPRLAPAHAAGALTYAGFAFDLSAWNTLGNPVTTFAPPLNLTLHYDSAQIPAPLGEQTINLYYWNGLWAPVALQTRNLDADTLTLALANTGEFALLGEDAYRIYLPLLMYNQAR